MNHLTRPIVTNERTDLSISRVLHVKCGVINKIFNFLFGELIDLVTLDKIKQILFVTRESVDAAGIHMGTI